MRVIHAQPRIAPSPINNKRVDRNPPPLLWPAEKGEDVRYAVRLSRDFDFPERSTIAEEDFPWAMFNPHRELAPEIRQEDRGIDLGVDVPLLTVGRERHCGSDATVLVEPSGVQRTTDTLPEAAR